MTTPTHSSSSPHHLPEPTPPLSRKSSAPLSAIQSPGNRHPALRRLQSCRAHSTANRCLSQQRYPSQTPRRARLASHTPQPVCMSLSMPARPLEHMRLSLMAAPWLSNRAVAGFPQGGPPGSGDDVPYHQPHQGRSRPSWGAPSIIQAIIEGLLLTGVLPDSISDYPPPRPPFAPRPLRHRQHRPISHTHTHKTAVYGLQNGVLEAGAVACKSPTSLRNPVCRAQDPPRRASKAVLRATTTTQGIQSQTTICWHRNVIRA